MSSKQARKLQQLRAKEREERELAEKAVGVENKQQVEEEVDDEESPTLKNQDQDPTAAVHGATANPNQNRRNLFAAMLSSSDEGDDDDDSSSSDDGDAKEDEVESNAGSTADKNVLAGDTTAAPPPKINAASKNAKANVKSLGKEVDDDLKALDEEDKRLGIDTAALAAAANEEGFRNLEGGTGTLSSSAASAGQSSSQSGANTAESALTFHAVLERLLRLNRGNFSPDAEYKRIFGDDESLTGLTSSSGRDQQNRDQRTRLLHVAGTSRQGVNFRKIWLSNATVEEVGPTRPDPAQCGSCVFSKIKTTTGWEAGLGLEEGSNKAENLMHEFADIVRIQELGMLDEFLRRQFFFVDGLALYGQLLRTRQEYEQAWTVIRRALFVFELNLPPALQFPDVNNTTNNTSSGGATSRPRLHISAYPLFARTLYLYMLLLAGRGLFTTAAEVGKYLWRLTYSTHLIDAAVESDLIPVVDEVVEDVEDEDDVEKSCDTESSEMKNAADKNMEKNDAGVENKHGRKRKAQQRKKATAVGSETTAHQKQDEVDKKANEDSEERHEPSTEGGFDPLHIMPHLLYFWVRARKFDAVEEFVHGFHLGKQTERIIRADARNKSVGVVPGCLRNFFPPMLLAEILCRFYKLQAECLSGTAEQGTAKESGNKKRQDVVSCIQKMVANEQLSVSDVFDWDAKPKNESATLLFAKAVFLYPSCFRRILECGGVSLDSVPPKQMAARAAGTVGGSWTQQQKPKTWTQLFNALYEYNAKSAAVTAAPAPAASSSSAATGSNVIMGLADLLGNPSDGSDGSSDEVGHNSSHEQDEDSRDDRDFPLELAAAERFHPLFTTEPMLVFFHCVATKLVGAVELSSLFQDDWAKAKATFTHCQRRNPVFRGSAGTSAQQGGLFQCYEDMSSAEFRESATDGVLPWKLDVRVRQGYGRYSTNDAFRAGGGQGPDLPGMLRMIAAAAGRAPPGAGEDIQEWLRGLGIGAIDIPLPDPPVLDDEGAEAAAGGPGGPNPGFAPPDRGTGDQGEHQEVPQEDHAGFLEALRLGLGQLFIGRHRAREHPEGAPEGEAEAPAGEGVESDEAVRRFQHEIEEGLRDLTEDGEIDRAGAADFIAQQQQLLRDIRAQRSVRGTGTASANEVAGHQGDHDYESADEGG